MNIEDRQTGVEIIRVHGTFASRDKDEGDAWWQCGSHFEQSLAAELGGAVRFADKAFHWSGENSTRAREEAAERLVDEMLVPREFGGTQRYVLIGHSHGGSVIETALCIAERRRLRLDFLAGIVSVGTPFFRRRAPASVLLYMGPTLLACWAFIHEEHLLVDIAHTWSALEVEGVRWAAVAALVSWLLLSLVGLSVGYAIGRRGWRWLSGPTRFAESVRRQWAGRWLSLWAPDDEAIGSLSGVAVWEGDLIPAISYPLPASGAGPGLWLVWLAGMPLTIPLCLLVLLYNRLIRNRVLIPVVTDLLKRQAFGDDVVGTDTVGVGREFAANPCPPVDTKPATERANQTMAHLIPNLRDAVLARFMDPMATATTDSAAFADVATGLVHCNYFETEPVKAAIADFVRSLADGVAPPQVAPGRIRARSRAGWRALVTVFVLAVVALLWGGVKVLGATYVTPHTARAAEAELARMFPALSPRSSGTLTDPLADWVVALALAGQVAAIDESLQGLQEHARDEVIRKVRPVLGNIAALRHLTRVSNRTCILPSDASCPDGKLARCFREAHATAADRNDMTALMALMEHQLACQTTQRAKDRVANQLMGAYAQGGEREKASTLLATIARDDFALAPISMAFELEEERAAWAAYATVDPSATEFRAAWESVKPDIRYSVLMRAALAWLDGGYVETSRDLVSEASAIARSSDWGGLDFCASATDRWDELFERWAAIGRGDVVDEMFPVFASGACASMDSGLGREARLSVAFFRAGDSARGRDWWQRVEDHRTRLVILERVTMRPGSSEVAALLALTEEEIAAASDLGSRARAAAVLARLGNGEAAQTLAYEGLEKVSTWRWGRDSEQPRLAVAALLAEVGWYAAAIRVARAADEPAMALRAQTAVLRAILRSRGVLVPASEDWEDFGSSDLHR